MKALSIRAPWWWAILKAGKDIENRDWKTNFRGRVLIHAGKWYKDLEVVDDLWTIKRILKIENDPVDNHRSLLKPHGGCIVGSVEIVDCVSNSDSPWFFGKYGFVLRNPIVLPSTPFKGALGFFEVPDEVLKYVE